MNVLKNKLIHTTLLSIGWIIVAVSQSTPPAPPPPNANRGPSFPGLPVSIDHELMLVLGLGLIVGIFYFLINSRKLSK